MLNTEYYKGILSITKAAPIEMCAGLLNVELYDSLSGLSTSDRRFDDHNLELANS